MDTGVFGHFDALYLSLSFREGYSFHYNTVIILEYFYFIDPQCRIHGDLGQKLNVIFIVTFSFIMSEPLISTEGTCPLPQGSPCCTALFLQFPRMDETTLGGFFAFFKLSTVNMGGCEMIFLFSFLMSYPHFYPNLNHIYIILKFACKRARPTGRAGPFLKTKNAKNRLVSLLAILGRMVLQYHKHTECC